MTCRPAVAAVGLWLFAAAALLAGCADGFAPLASSLTWRHFLAGADLRLACDDGAPDRYRMALHDRVQGRIRLVEVIEDRAAGGAAARSRILTAADMGGVDIGDDYFDWFGEVVAVRLSPLQFARLAYRLDQLGAFDTPEFGAPPPPAAVGWLISGCRSGAPFFNVFPDPATAGELIVFRVIPPRR